MASLGGSTDEGFKKAFKGFEEKFNVTIRWVPGNSTENLAKAVASQKNPEYDAVILEHNNFYDGSTRGVWEKLDPAIVTNVKDLVPQAVAKNNDGAGLGFIATGIFYKTDEFKKNGWAPPTSWEDLFRPEFCGRIGMNHPNVTYPLYLAMILGGGIEKIDAGMQKLSQLAKCIPVLEPSASKLEEKIQLGEYVIGQHASIRVIPFIQKGYPIQFVYPKEGASLTISMVGAVKGAPHAKLAQEFVNWFISPEAQEIVMKETMYGPTNAKVKVPQNLLDLGVPDAERVKTLFKADEKTLTENRKKWTDAFERLMAH